MSSTTSYYSRRLLVRAYCYGNNHGAGRNNNIILQRQGQRLCQSRSMTSSSSSRPFSSTAPSDSTTNDDAATATSATSTGGGGGGGGGAGYGNVRDRVMTTSRRQLQQTMFHHCACPKTCSLISAPMTYGQPFVGTDTAAQLLKQAGLRNLLTALQWRVEDITLDFETTMNAASPSSTNSGGAHYVDGNAKNPMLVGQGTHQVAELVADRLAKRNFPLILGGDHSIGLGSLAGILTARPDTGILWIDAHADLNTPATSESGNMHGMPVGMLMRGVYDKDAIDSNAIYPPGFEWLTSDKYNNSRLDPGQIVYVGLRDVDHAEREAIQSLGVTAYTMHDIDRYGIGPVMEMAIHHLLDKNPDRPLHLSYDIDAVDPVLAPATGTTVRGGLTFREAHYVAEAVTETGNLASAEIVELNPTLATDEGAKATIDLGLQIITSFMGKSII